MIRVVMIYDPAYNSLPPVVAEYEDGDPGLRDGLAGVIENIIARGGDIASFSVQRVTQWWPATWRQVLQGCEVKAPDGTTWVVARALSPTNPHEVEIYKFGQPEVRHTFTPLYDAPVQARFTQEASMLALLMTELGARVID